VPERRTRLTVEPLTRDRWPQLETFFGPSGAYANCWCTYFRQSGAAFEAGCRDRGTGNRALLHRLTDEGRVPGLIGSVDGAPVGWVSVGPRPDFGRVLRSPLLDKAFLDEGTATWSVVCFWVPREHRGTGVGRALLDGAVRHARTEGAAVLEAYPIDTAGQRRPSSSVYQGTLALFTAARFEVAYRRKADRPVVRRQLRRPAGARGATAT
jgi:GNAT superfamily N-acetyltransferase